jgi:excisionase family DNA binding protein
MAVSEKTVSHSIPEACSALGISRQTLYDLINAGELRSYNVGRRRFVSHQAILDLIKRKETENQSHAA